MSNTSTSTEVKLPFYLRIDQPWRGIIMLLISCAIAAVIYLVGTMPIFWPAAQEPIAYAMLPNALMCIFVMMFMFQMHGFNWPFNKIAQPAQFVVGSLVAIITGGILYYILGPVLHLDADIFNIASAWFFWMLLFGPWTGMPIAQAYKFKQPATLITGFIVTLGWALFTWWVIPSTFRGFNTGIPFAYFSILVLISFNWQDWPVRVEKAKYFILFGYLVLFGMLLLLLFKVLGFDQFAVPGDPSYGQGGAALNVFMLALLIPNVLFQHWPLQKLSPWWRGLIANVVGGVAGILIFKYIILPATGGDWASLMKVVSIGFSFFVAIFLYSTMGGGAMASPIKGTVGWSEVKNPAQ